MASLTKCLATATAVMQLYEQGKVQFDDPVQKYLPDFNTANDPSRAGVTVRMLLTHTSGEASDVSLKDPWGLNVGDKTEGIHRALTRPLQSGPGAFFRYSDINFILLGALIEKVTGEAEDVYVQHNVFAPLGMEDTHYLSPAKWSTGLLSRIAPAAHDDEAEPTRARIPTLITCFGAACMTRRRAAWVEWPGMPVCSRRRTMSASTRRLSLIGSRAGRASFR
jgi:CubicO group peptidase (beta-lactamase class C family)